MLNSFRTITALSCVLTIATAANAQQPAASTGPATIASKTAGMEKRDGFIPLYLDEKNGKILMEVPHDSMKFLLFAQEATGLGSNPLGFDRGAADDDRVVHVQRTGDRLLLVVENWKYRSSLGASSPNGQSVMESFPPSTMASMPVLATENGKILVDATDLFIRDWLAVGERLQSEHEGSYSLAKDRSSVYTPFTKGFPDNTEIDIAQTFVANGAPGNTVSQVAADGHAFTLRVHYSLVRLPNDDYRPRVADPRIGFFGVDFKDFGQPIQGRLDVHWISRFRLERTNPNDPNSPIKNPIVYYIDPAIPEPMHSASVTGAKFWSEAFDRAGLKGGFVVKDLPAGADPMDVRYNMVLWINRNERGWSFGGSMGDPRTGENLKGVAHMDSHRNRTAYNLYAALMGANPTPADTHFVLGRVRQVTAHEIGHTLGLAHNYIASTYERGSVMDYPAPRIMLNDKGAVDVSQAYAMGPGDYDVWAIHWGYGIFPAASEADSLKAIMAEGLKKGYLYLTDQDARPDFASDPRTNLWDDAATATLFLQRQMDVRRVAMKEFGLRNIREGEPVALLHDRFVPLYLFHRFGISATARTLGGHGIHLRRARRRRERHAADRSGAAARGAQDAGGRARAERAGDPGYHPQAARAGAAGLQRRRGDLLEPHAAGLRRTGRRAHARANDRRRRAAEGPRGAAGGIRAASDQSAHAERDDRRARRGDADEERDRCEERGAAQGIAPGARGPRDAAGRRFHRARPGTRDRGVQAQRVEDDGEGAVGHGERGGSRLLVAHRERHRALRGGGHPSETHAGAARAAGRSLRRGRGRDLLVRDVPAHEEHRRRARARVQLAA